MIILYTCIITLYTFIISLVSKCDNTLYFYYLPCALLLKYFILISIVLLLILIILYTCMITLVMSLHIILVLSLFSLLSLVLFINVIYLFIKMIILNTFIITAWLRFHVDATQGTLRPFGTSVRALQGPDVRRSSCGLWLVRALKPDAEPKQVRDCVGASAQRKCPCVASTWKP